MKIDRSTWKHFIAGILIGMLFFLMAYYHFKLGFLISTLITIGASTIIGSLKEWLDYSNRDRMKWKKWDWIDLLFTVLGSLAPVALVGLISLLT